MKIRLLILALVVISGKALAQFVPEHVSNTAIYAFLDELAAEKVIALNSAVKPYSRALIASRLVEANGGKDQLTRRQQQELAFYLKAYRMEAENDTLVRWDEKLNLFRKKDHLATSLQPFGLHYKDGLFAFSVRPVYGVKYFRNENGSVTHTYGGLEAYSTIDKHWGIYASLRDNHQSQLLARPLYFTQEPGGAFKENEGGRKGGDYSEMRAGITYAWKWGDAGLVKDHFVWGNHQHGSNIFSGRTPSFAHIRLHLHPAKWIDFNYVHGWLVSMVVDSNSAYPVADRNRTSYRPKFMAANMLTLTPINNLNISVGNSILYSDLGGIHPAYLIPLAFYKSMDHTLNRDIDNQNSQMYLDISSRQIRHLHLFATVFVDEFSVTRLKVKEDHNFLSWKGGLHLSGFPVRNLALKSEFTRTTPITYKHYVPVLTFESNRYNLGHYLRDNSQEVYLALEYRPFSRMQAALSYTSARHGGEFVYDHSPNLTTHPFLTYDTYTDDAAELSLQYQLLNNIYLYAGYAYRKVSGYDADGQSAQYYLDRFSAPFYQGKTSTVSVGFSMGF